MMLQFLKSGTHALTPGLQLARGLVGNQGPRGTVGFMTGFRRAGARHKATVETFLRAVVGGNNAAAIGTLSSTATITLGDEEALDAVALIEQLRGASWTKVIGAGPTVVVSVDSDRGRGIIFADVARKGHEINQIRYFAA
jgi:hypothetical protein